MRGMNCAAPRQSGKTAPNFVSPRPRPPTALPLRIVLGIGISLMVADCASQSSVSRSGSDIDPKLGVRASRRLYAEGEEIPKGGGKHLVGNAYTVAGRTYVPHEVSRYSVVGLASWYGSAFHGRLTANGEVFDRFSISAAHKTLPLPSYARVTNIRNGRSIIVRVNDRGPYHSNRVMDVSERVAEVLDFKRMGTTQIQLDYVRPASLSGSDDRKLLATLRTDGSDAALDGPASAPAMVASADLNDTPRASGPGAPIAAIASAVSAASPFSRPAAMSVAANGPAPRATTLTTVTYANGASGTGAAPAAEPAIAQMPEDEEPANTTVIRNDAGARVTTAFAPLPPERPYELGITTVAKTQQRNVQTQPSPAGEEGDVVAPRPPTRPKQLVSLFFAPERLADTQSFIPGNPFAGLKPQSFVRLREQ
jgi:rare lipoprotein A